ncbi:MAG: Lrp/AsnC family transcriptional regulator [Halieaceae bacterium]|jgi:Lrp/AsnC family transcriptional regulator for asnA, asnC and gidA|nr:Lrp/AsnC family transcriptional regulator [Halieaceae bacterium]
MSDVELDPVDERIIELLRADGRLSYRAMAAELGLTESTVRSRVRRLEQSNAMRVVAVTDFQAAGYELLLAVGIQVSDRSPVEVAEALADIPEIFSINIMIGAYDIEVLAVAEDQAALSALIYQRLARLPGVRRVVPSMAMDVLKNQPDWVPLSAPVAQTVQAERVPAAQSGALVAEELS